MSKTARAVCIALSMLALFLFGIRLGKRQLPTDVVIQRDTLVARDTTTLITYVDRVVYRTRIDTVWLEKIGNSDFSHADSASFLQNQGSDSENQQIPVQVPIDYIHEKYTDAEVWYHGFRAGIDSLQVYPEKQIITNTITRTIQPSRWALSVHGGFGISAKGLTPYIGVGISYEVLRFGPKRGRVRSNAGE